MKLDLGFVGSAVRFSLSVLFSIVSAGEAVSQVLPQGLAVRIPVNCGDRIQAPGLYVLTQNLDCTSLTNAGRSAVGIVSGNVQFDLQGFTLAGAISVSEAARVTITNGTVDVFSGAFAIPSIRLSNVQQSRIEGVTVRNGGNISAGLSISGGGSNLIRRNDIRSSGEAIFLGDSAVAVSIIRNYIAGTGLGLAVAETVRDTVIVSNEIDGSDLGAASIRGTGGLIEDCQIRHPVFLAGDKNTVRNNTITGPDRRTLVVVSGNGNLIEGNTVTNSSDLGLPAGGGIRVTGSGNVIRANTATGAIAPESDLSGPENTCTENRWRNNTFGTASPECIR